MLFITIIILLLLQICNLTNSFLSDNNNMMMLFQRIIKTNKVLFLKQQQQVSKKILTTKTTTTKAFLSSPSSSLSLSSSSEEDHHHVCIVGGGLAGLSVAYNLLNKTTKSQIKNEQKKLKITIIDKSQVGNGGASSVAGGLLHPFSPSGKLIHLGLEGLDATNKLINIAMKYSNTNTSSYNDTNNNNNEQSSENNHNERDNHLLLRNGIYRIALNEKHVNQLKETSKKYPNYCTWLSSNDIIKHTFPPKTTTYLDNNSNNNNTTKIMGGLFLDSGKVIHVPTYLKCLWLACLDLSNNTAKWHIINDIDNKKAGHNEQQDEWWEKNIIGKNYDTIILTAGSGLFQSNIISSTNNNNDNHNLPIQLVRGRSIEMSLQQQQQQQQQQQKHQQRVKNNDNDDGIEDDNNFQYKAVLCGKYISPLPDKNKLLIGATHEYNYNEQEDNSSDEIIKITNELKERTKDFVPWLWEEENNTIIGNNNDNSNNDDEENNVNCYKVDKVTSGFRVQTKRTQYGRIPIIGQLKSSSSSSIENNLLLPKSIVNNNNSNNKEDIWIFTGLSSRGLIHHALYGDILTDSILSSWNNNEREQQEGEEEEVQLPPKYNHINWWKNT